LNADAESGNGSHDRSVVRSRDVEGENRPHHEPGGTEGPHRGRGGPGVIGHLLEVVAWVGDDLNVEDAERLEVEPAEEQDLHAEGHLGRRSQAGDVELGQPPNLLEVGEFSHFGEVRRPTARTGVVRVKVSAGSARIRVVGSDRELVAVENPEEPGGRHQARRAHDQHARDEDAGDRPPGHGRHPVNIDGGQHTRPDDP
jgi:hypothetical protein